MDQRACPFKSNAKTLVFLAAMCSKIDCDKIETSRTEFGQQMRSRELSAYLSLNRLLNGILSYS